MPTLTHHLKHDTARLQQSLGVEFASARIEVQCLLQQVLQVSRAYLLAYGERELAGEALATYEALLARRLAGEPLAYLQGEREFFGLRFKVTSATLIPRPDTELLVELALAQLPAEQPRRVLDLGTGSGAIAISVAAQRPLANVTALDASAAALAVAAENAEKLLGPGRLRLLHSDWFSAVGTAQFDLLLSNPPYIAAADPHLAALQFEPASALAAGADGLDDIRQLVQQAPAHLVPGGWLWLEHGYDQAAAVRDLLQQRGFSSVRSERDLAGIERATGGCWAAEEAIVAP